MRFGRGVAFGALCLALWIIFSLLAALAMSDATENEEFNLDDGMKEAPLWTIGMFLSFFGIFIFPLYYWIIEPLLQKRKPSLPARETKFCMHCRAIIAATDNFCQKCGKSQY